MQIQTLLTATLAFIPALCAPHRATGALPDRTSLASAVETSSVAHVPSGWHVATVLLADGAPTPSAVPIAVSNAVAGESKFYLSTLHTSDKLAESKCPIGKHHEPVDCISKRVRGLLGEFFREPVVEERVGDFGYDKEKRDGENEGEEQRNGDEEEEDRRLYEAQEELADALFEGYKPLWGHGVLPFRRDLEGEKEDGEGEGEVRKLKPWGEPVEPEVHYFDSDPDDGRKGKDEEEEGEWIDPWNPILPPAPVVRPWPHHNDEDLGGKEPTAQQWQGQQMEANDALLLAAQEEKSDPPHHPSDFENGKSEMISRADTSPLSPKDTTHKPPVDTGKFGPFTGDIYWLITNETAWSTFGESTNPPHSKSHERKIGILTSKISEYIASNSASETCVAMVKDGEQFASVVVTFGEF